MNNPLRPLEVPHYKTLPERSNTDVCLGHGWTTGLAVVGLLCSLLSCAPAETPKASLSESPQPVVETPAETPQDPPIEPPVEPPQDPPEEPPIEPPPVEPPPTPPPYPLVGVWQNQGDPNLIWVFGEASGSESTCGYTFNWSHLYYTGNAEFGAGQIQFTNFSYNYDPALYLDYYCQPPSGVWKQTRTCSWYSMAADHSLMEIHCYYGAGGTPASNNIWVRQ